MTNDIRVSLEGIEQGLDKLSRSIVLQRLQPGVSPQHVHDMLASCGLPSSKEIEYLYGWRNGTDIEHAPSLDAIYLFPGFYFLSIEDAVTNYRVFTADPRWEVGWVPVFANGGGDFYVLSLFESKPDMIRRFRIDEIEHPIEFESISSMVATLAAGFERGVFYIDQNGYFEMDDLVFAKMAAKMNPGITWWND